MHILMKNQGCLISLPSLKSDFSWEIWNMDFLSLSLDIYMNVCVCVYTLLTKNTLREEVLKFFNLLFW